MFRYVLALFLVLAPDDISDAIARAEALYYEARFKESIQMLLRAEEMLRPQTGRVQDRISVKLQLALAHVGLNDNAQAKSALRELYGLNADYRLDPQQYSPKVLMLADEARVEQNEIRCQAVRNETRRHLDGRNGAAALEMIGSMKSKCTGLDALEPETAELLYRAGLEDYKKNEFSAALDKFRTVLTLAPKHELAVQYVELAQGKLQVTADRAALEAQKSRLRVEYKKAMSPLVEAWNRACAGGDEAGMEAVRKQVAQQAPDPAVAQEVLAQIATCTKKGCLQMATQLALARLKVRVNPDVPNSIQDMARRSPMTVRVKVKIDERGDTEVLETIGDNAALNEAIRVALKEWKFSPAVDPQGPRCMETEIPVVVRPNPAR
jgi:tetratricopeptide (TPR) repeat protein